MPSENAYLDFLKLSLADNTIGSYKSALSGEPLKKVLRRFGYNSIYDVSDINALTQIKNAAKYLPENGHNTITSAVQKYIELIQIKGYSNSNSKSSPVEPSSIPVATEIKSIQKNPSISTLLNNPLQQILFGAPGTGKSHTIKSKYLADVPEENIFRTTFHPDYDYAQFVGSYKPKKNGAVITYDFVPQVFAKAYKRAKETSEPVYLVIEEINRGNCAQIFGDIFQLLDRNESGESQYEIDVDSDFAEWLGESKIKLPPNFNILATMNTSDQSLFPMDSAFKRRFDWEYVPISFEGKSAANFQIEIGSSENVKYYSWQTFVEKVNAKILDLTESEDKQLGEYFIQPDKKLNDSDTEKTVISEERFKGKVIFYLWNEICKDEHKNGSFFKIENDFFTFQDLYKDDSKLAAFMEEIEKTGKN